MIPVVAIFDVGKTNKKLLLFDERYQLQYEKQHCFEETEDEDGFPCEDVHALISWLRDSLSALTSSTEFQLKAVNFSAYGASLVHVGESGSVLTPLYNYLKPYPTSLKKKFYDDYGGEVYFSKVTASPVLGSLNSGMQLYRLKYEHPEIFERIKFSLHLSQYLSYVVTGKPYSEITSIGCHTSLWDFRRNTYHAWVRAEGMDQKLAPIRKGNEVHTASKGLEGIAVGIGLHDSSSAMIPYLKSRHEPFVLLSTGTWSISLNPFNNVPLMENELSSDCLYYMSYTGQPVKASRIFSGHGHEEQIRRLASYFNVDPMKYKSLAYRREAHVRIKEIKFTHFGGGTKPSAFANRDLSLFASYDDAYHQLVCDLVAQQVASTQLVLEDKAVKHLIVDGGFGKNSIYMNVLAAAFSEMKVYAARVPQASALGAALVIHEQWNSSAIPGELVELVSYPPSSPHP